MDVSTLPDLMQHFSIAIQFMPEIVHTAVEPIRNMVAAFGDESEYTASEKLYHAGKFMVLGGLLGFTLATLNIEGILGTAFAQADEINELCHKGWSARHKGGEPTPPIA